MNTTNETLDLSIRITSHAIHTPKETWFDKIRMPNLETHEERVAMGIAISKYCKI